MLDDSRPFWPASFPAEGPLYTLGDCVIALSEIAYGSQLVLYDTAEHVINPIDNLANGTVV